MIRDVKQTEPDKPWYLWFCPGANHAPHHAPQEYIDKYKGMFDDGYEAYREWVLARMIEKGIVPEGTELTPLNPMPEGSFSAADEVRPWDSLDAEEKAMFSRMAEVYAGFSEYTDAQVGRIVDYLEESGQLDNTLIIYCADNGASGEGSPNGSVNEGKIFGGYPDDEAENLRMVDKLGSPDTYNHYPTGWAAAFSTPYKMFKRYTYQGGVCDPLVIHWPAGISARGEVRHQYHHSTDIVPTILGPAASSSQRCTTASSRRRCPASRWRTRSTRRRRHPRRRRRSTTRCSGSAASGTTAGRPSPSTARSAARGTSTRTNGSCTTPTSTAPRPSTSPRSTRTSSRSSRRSGWKRRRPTRCSR